MFWSSILFNVFLGSVFVGAHIGSIHPKSIGDRGINSKKHIKSMQGNSHNIHMYDKHRKIHKNITYVDVPNNSMHVPFQNMEHVRQKKRVNKRYPKRTIQKIIRMGRNKRKYFLALLTSTPAPRLQTQDLDEYGTEKDIIQTTTHPAHHKPRNTFKKYARNPKPFQKFHRRPKRSIERDNTYILQDFDQIEFLSKEHDFNDANVYNVRVKPYW